MRRRIICLATASLAYGNPHVFSVNDDVLAYPQYEVVFSDSYISDNDARSHLSHSSSTSTSTPSQDTSIQPTAELSQRPDGTTQDSPPSSYERLILDSTPYLCSIPSPPPAGPKNATTASQAEEEEAAELARATDRGWDLLQEMTGTCLYFISGWWSYSFCYANSVKQFHQLAPGKNTPIFPPQEDPTTPSYILGRFGEKVNRHRLSASEGGSLDGGLPPKSGEGTTTTIQAKGSPSSRYLSQKLSGGTTCDLTGAPRKVEIQFHCHPQSAERIGWIKEVSTCSYLMVIYTPRLCNDVAFLPPREERAEQISCREVVPEDAIPAWHARKSKDAERALVDATAASASVSDEANGRVFVGGIEVGGMNLLGRDGQRLETPQLVLPPSHYHHHQEEEDGVGEEERIWEFPFVSSSSGDGEDETEGETIARQDSQEEGGRVWMYNEKELKKRGLDGKTTDKAVRELREMARGRSWRLEVVDVGGGERELRGVIEPDKGEEGVAEGGDGAGWDGEGDAWNGHDGTEELYRDEL